IDMDGVKDTVYVDVETSRIVAKLSTNVFENDSMAIYRIDSVAFFGQMNQHPIAEDSIPYISELAEATRQLEGMVEFGAWNETSREVEPVAGGGIPIRVHAKNGREVELKETDYCGEVYFSRYY